MSVELPKDAEGREIPLDTEVLYSEDGRKFEVDYFTYSVRQSIPNLKWGIVFMNCRYDYCSSFFLTPPEPPDSWKKLEEDLDRCIEESNLCMYYNQNLDCNNCTISGNETRGCTSIALEDIKKRIRKLRGEG